jgi:hypothetical protein
MPIALPLRNILDGTSLPSTSTMKTALGQLRDYLSETLGDTGGGSSGLKNRLINGAMKINQRTGSNSATFLNGAALAFGPDRWYVYSTGSASQLTGARIALANGQNRYRLTGAAFNTAFGFGQRIEAANSMDMAGNTVTLQAKLSSTNLTTINWQLFYANGTHLFGTVASPTRTSIASGSFTIGTAEATYSTQISLPAAATTGLELLFTGGALGNSQTFTIGDVQLENSTSLTPFDHQRPAGLELSLCQRHCFVTSTIGAIAFGYMYGTTGGSFNCPTPVALFGSITLSNPAISGTPRISTQAGFATINAYANVINNYGSVSFAATTSTALTSGVPAYIDPNGSAYIFESEL